MSVTIKHTGFAGHLCVGRDCRFHLRTEVGDYVVSTVGAYDPDKRVREIREQPKGWVKIGWGRLFETMVFPLGGPCSRDGCGCGEREVASFSEEDFEGYQTAAEAIEGHNAMVAKWAAKQEASHAS